ncbi:hypothetical protein Hanom_Chr00s000003g01605291 [Helianthus anomalus]
MFSDHPVLYIQATPSRDRASSPPETGCNQSRAPTTFVYTEALQSTPQDPFVINYYTPVTALFSPLTDVEAFYHRFYKLSHANEAYIWQRRV